MSEQTRPAACGYAISKSDSADLANGPCRAIYVGVTGDVAVVAPNGATVTYKAVPVGILPVQAKRVNSTNTTATDMVALY